MRNRLSVLFMLGSCAALAGFIGRISGDGVTEKDVQLKIPGTFPEPFYNFKNNKVSAAGFILGRRLFYDPILSRDSTVSCESCHQRVAAFAHIDHPLSHGIDSRTGTRNVPALQNLIWQNSYMWDGGVNNLEVQPLNPITNPDEMGESLLHVLEKLRQNKEYVSLFRRVYKDTAINSERLLKALAQFTGLMISANSRYDRYMQGTDTFSLQEKNGLALFRNKCAGCHKEPLFTDNSYRNNGLKPDTSINDKGRSMITGNPADNFKFRVPGLRNIEMTFPYMHDGRFRKLKDVLSHYGSPEKRSGSEDKVLTGTGALDDKEKKDIIAFLLTLTDKDFINDRRFMNPDTR